MPEFEYQAKNLQGMVIKGKLEAPNKEIAAANLRSKNYFPIYVKQYKKSLNIDINELSRVSIKDISIFCRQFSVITNAGISLMRGLEIIQQQTENAKLKRVLEEVHMDVQKGQSLSDSMKKHKEFPEMLVNMIGVGETGGTLDKILIRMAEYYEKEFTFNQKVKQAMTYPISVGVMSILVIVLLIVKVLPTFVETLNAMGATQLPLPTRIVIAVSNFTRTKGWLLLIILGVVIFLFIKYKQTEDGRYNIDKLLLKLPIFGKIIQKIITARFARTFGMLMSSGVPVIQCLATSCGVIGNRVIEKVLKSSIDEISKGVSTGESLESKKIFPPMLTQMVKIGEEAGTLDEVLETTAKFYDQEVDTVTEQLNTIMQPVIIVFLGVIVGGIILAVMMPMFQMYSAVSNQG